jgi:hypothetical protein
VVSFSIILFAQLFCRQFLYLTRHLLPLPLTMNYNPHSQGPYLRNQSNSQKKKQLHWPFKWWVMHILLAPLFSQKFLSLTCDLPPLLLAMNYKPTTVNHPSLSIKSNGTMMVFCHDWFMFLSMMGLLIIVDTKYSRHKFQNKNYVYRHCITSYYNYNSTPTSYSYSFA